MEIKHYFKKDNDATIKDLEKDFIGLKYCKCVGLEARGARKNVYTENYADSDEIRVWQGKDVTREATEIVFTFYFLGDSRQSIIDSFYEYIKNGLISYWDTKRYKKAYMIFKDKFTISEDMFVGSTPYKKVDVTFQNLWGECKNCDASGNVLSL